MQRRQFELLATALILGAALLLLYSSSPVEQSLPNQNMGNVAVNVAVADIDVADVKIKAQNLDQRGVADMHTPDSNPPSRTVLCKQKESTDSGWRPTIIFIAGLEGCGHHGIVPLVRDLGPIIFIKKAEGLLTDFWDPTVSIERRIEIRELLLTAIQEKFDQCVSNSTRPSIDCSHYVLFGNANFFSYPYDSPRSPLRHPDLLELMDIVEDPSLGARFDLKIVVLHRQPFSMVQSNLRREFVTPAICAAEVNRGKRIRYKGPCDALLYLAREAEMSMAYFNSELSAMSAEYFRVVDYSQLVQNPEKYAGLLARFLSLDDGKHDLLSAGMKKRFRGHVKRPPLLKKDREQYLSDLFNPLRRLRWQLIDSGEFDLDAIDTGGFSGTGETRFGYKCADR